MTDPITTPAQMREALDRALAEYIIGIDRAVRFVTIDQVDMLAEFYLHNRALPVAEQQAIRDRALDDAAQCCDAEADRCDDAVKWGGQRRYIQDCKAAAYAMRDRAYAIRAMKGKPE